MKKQRINSYRLGGGEFQYKDGFNVNRLEPRFYENGPQMEQIHRQSLFLEAVFEFEPKVMSSLEAVLAKIPGEPKERPIPPLVERNLQEWCSRWNLNAPWCLEFSQQMASHRSLLSKPGVKNLSFKSMKASASAQLRDADPFKDQHLQIDFGSWLLTQQTKAVFREECERTFRREFNAFCDRLEEQAVAAGMERTHEKRELDHFLWLARHLIKGETFAEIQRSTPTLSKLTPRAIGKAISALARELEFALPGKSSDALQSTESRLKG